MNKTPEQLKEEQDFFDYIRNYKYINEQGRLDLELFCCLLSSCFFLDGIRELSPNPRDVYNLLIECLEEFNEYNEQDNWVQYQKLSDWTPYWGRYYPDKIRTYIHVIGLLYARELWIYHIGHELIGIPKADNDKKYYGWVKEEWTFVHTFIDGFHNFFWELQKNMDRESIKKNGYSIFEAFHKSITEDIDLDDAVKSVKDRHIHHEEGIHRIQLAIDEGFYLEAITLEECIISNYLNNFLRAKKVNLPKPTFAALLGKIKSKKFLKTEDHFELFKKINRWREQRNTAIHGFVTSRESATNSSLDSFISFAKSTAEDGIDHVLQVKQWYNNECVDYLEHKFPSPKGIEQ